jgi:hypothetical protein
MATEFLLPPDLGIASATPNLDANTSSFKSPTVGSTRTAERLGDALRFQFNFATVNDNPATARKRGRLQAFLQSLRGQSARVWMTPPGATLRGSFPAAEMFVNNDFSNGISGWASTASFSLTSIDRGARATRLTMISADILCAQSITKLAGVPYCIRGFVSAGKGNASICMSDNVTFSTGSVQQGMLEGAFTSPGNANSAGFFDFAASGEQAGYFSDLKWSSFTQCALVDNGVNLLLNSDTLGTGTGWSLNAAATGAQGSAGPDGVVDSWFLLETTANSGHYAVQLVNVPASALDYSVSVFVAPGMRSWCFLQAVENIGGTSVLAYFNASTGAVGTATGGANMTLISAIPVPCGNNWFRFILTFRKTNASTAITLLFGAAAANGTQIYVGSTSAVAILMWRASFAQSSVPVAAVQTTSAAVAGTPQTGLQLNLKGLPISSQGLLLPGDYIECGLQLNQMASRLDSDAAGLGTAILVRPPRNSPADSAGFVVNTPMGKFMVSSNSTAWNEIPGRVSSASIELVEDISF